MMYISVAKFEDHHFNNQIYSKTESTITLYFNLSNKQQLFFIS